MRPPQANYGISRIDQPKKRNHGWFVRITLHGVVQSKFFADKSCGGKAAALELARAHRDALIRQLPRERQEAIERRRRRLSRSHIKGITHGVACDPGGSSYEYWEAAWVDRDGSRHTTRYSVDDLGSRRALALARQQLMEHAAVPPRPAAPRRNKKAS